MSGILYVILDLLIAVILMCILQRQLLVRKFNRVAITLAVGLLYGIIVQFGILDVAIEEVINMAITCVCTYIVCEIPWKKFWVPYIIAVLIGAMLQALMTIFVPAENNVAVKIFTLIAVLIFGVILIYTKKSINFELLPKKLLFGVSLMFIALIVVTVCLFYSTDIRNQLHPIIIISVMVAIIAVFGITLETISSELTKLGLQKEKAILQSYNDQQQRYYELVLKSEEDTRRFRHDMMNHMLCLESYLEEGKVDECKTYIGNITDSINHSRNKIYYTGNKISDVMLTNILENKKPDVKVTVTGRLKDDIPIPDFDLCVVVSNIVKNAVEAVNKQSDDSEKYIKINFTLGKRYLRIEEWNSIDTSQIENAKNFETAKEDKKAHGLGVKNVKMIVEKYNGKFKSEVKDNEFYVCVEMDMKSAK